MKASYQERATNFTAQAERLTRQYNRFSLVRLLVFLAGLLLGIFAWTAFPFYGGILYTGVFLYLFYRFVQWHQRIQKAAQHLLFLAKINTDEAACLDGEFQQFDQGNAFFDAQHPYSLDLDIFGAYSLFQFSNRGNTHWGKARLAAYYTKPADLATIAARQGAIRELRDQLDWRQNLQAYGLESEEHPEHLQLLEKWLHQTPFLFGQRWLKYALWILPVFTIGALIYAIPTQAWYVDVALLLPAALLLRRYVERVNEAHRQTTHAERALSLYADLIQHIEKATFSSPLLHRLHAVFGGNASRDIRELSYIISQLNVRYNAFAFVLNILGLWDLQWVYRLEKWKARHRDRLPEWFEAMAEFEALSSLANLSHNQPDWVFANVSSDTLQLEAIDLGHPLIHPDKRVCNDLQMPTDGHIKLITGSNMAGKSTLLRTVGLNIVLAMCGAPVCARRFELPPLLVYTSMRTQDALHESTSSFYAELKRLKVIIEAVENPPEGVQVFFLLDEILKGTNSRDRHTGSKALIEQLIRSQGAGLIATHDLELGQLESQANGAIENLCMEVEIREGKLYFDYKLKKGVSASFNATLLMQQMGIRIQA
ncbi:MAG TPA: MutS family DNA mismatch repair protein [Saprospiraceae bacterium]|nr:MutS family DNA mismatch repair protein [Saprospiraceae bacterium]HMQ82936.1 MutS family DNA mismatch repair protein [Saprospiraceae bacterium]